MCRGRSARGDERKMERKPRPASECSAVQAEKKRKFMLLMSAGAEHRSAKGPQRCSALVGKRKNELQRERLS